MPVPTINIRVNLFDKTYAVLPGGATIVVDGVLNPADTSAATATTFTSVQRIQDSITVTVTKAGFATYTEVIQNHYGADGNLEDIVFNVIMFATATLAADLITFIDSNCPPVTRIKGDDPAGDEYFFVVTMNNSASWTTDWEYPVATPIGTGPTITWQFGTPGIKTMQVITDIGGGHISDCSYSFILYDRDVKVCYAQELVRIDDSLDQVICTGDACTFPFDMSLGLEDCCKMDPREFKFIFKNLGDFPITIDPVDCLPLSNASGINFDLVSISDFTVFPQGEYTVTVSFDPEVACSCVGLSSTITISLIEDGAGGECCNFTFQVIGTIVDKEFTLSLETVQLLSAVDECVQAISTLTNSGCANLKVPTLILHADASCLELNIPMTYDYDAAQLAALPLDGDGDPYLAPAATIDIIFEYCPVIAQDGCCPVLDAVGECNTMVITACYRSIVPPSCLEFPILPCDSIRLSVPDDAIEVIADELTVTSVTPLIDLRIQGNAFFPQCADCGDPDLPCELLVDFENLTTGETLATITFDPDTFNYANTPIWNSIIQFPTAGIWEVTVTAHWCGQELICKKQFTVCHDVSVTRIECHKRRVAITTTIPLWVTVLVESVNGAYTESYVFYTGSISYIDIQLPADDAYRLTINYYAFEDLDVPIDTTQVIYIDEICGLSECFREMVIKILCNETDPCCESCNAEEKVKQEKLRYMVNQIMALFLSLTAIIHKDTMAYLGIWEDDACRESNQQDISTLIEALKAAIERCGVCEESIATNVTTAQGCQNC